MSGTLVEPPLVKRDANQGMYAGHEGFALDKPVFVIQRNIAVLHAFEPPELLETILLLLPRNCLPILRGTDRFVEYYSASYTGVEKLSYEIDEIDKRILIHLQDDASLSVAEIAESVGLSSSPCWRRIKRMEEAGLITGRVTLLNRDALGLGFEVVANVKLALPSKDNLAAFEALVSDWPEVTECMTVTGAIDYIIRVTTTDMHAYDSFLRDKLLGSALVSDVQSRIIINVAKRTTALPLDLVAND